jgi:peptidoglycan/xylan/chitin deacetylase (PgdA/CDA1 family)
MATGRSFRSIALAVVITGHALALIAAFLAPWWLALLILSPAAFCVIWGCLYPHSRLFGPALSRMADVRENVVWLTIDDGPSPDTPALLDVLQRHDAVATFFLVGARARRYPRHARAVVQQGHQVGNHSDSHPSASFWSLLPRAMTAQVASAQATLSELSGMTPAWFRAVAGQANLFVAPVLRRFGLHRASWTARGFDTVDDDDGRVLQRLVAGISPGAILLLHEDERKPGRSVRLLDRVLQELSARGYATVLPVPADADSPDGAATTSQLLNGVRPHSGEQSSTRNPSDSSSPASPARVG